ncbi:MAG: hypothetical protein WC302_01015 [Candidatus Paceibacterota bacterium]
MRRIILTQFIVLLIGTVFAWLNFFNELMNWLSGSTCATGCATGLANPFLTPCFYGAIFFTIAFILGVVILKRARK